MHPRSYQELALRDLQTDPKYHGWTKATEPERSALLESMREYGMESPLIVMELDGGAYQIVDGHRRYAAARELDWQTVWCLVHPPMSEGEVLLLRYRLHNLTKPWTKAELRSHADRRQALDSEGAEQKHGADH